VPKKRPGNRTVLVDQQLTGQMIGMTLHTHAAEMYRALIEATAFGALTISGWRSIRSRCIM
jgi:L-ribulokinase